MSYADLDDGPDDDFYRWFVGGSPPEADGWPRDAFANALWHCDAPMVDVVLQSTSSIKP